MVLVTESWRRRGLATRLVDTCLNTATRLGLTTWLDATPAGAAVYGPLGFTPTIQLRRLRLEQASGPAAQPAPGKIDELITCDISAMGFDRRELLHELGSRATSRVVSSGEAMALVRDGRTARHIGPLFATTPTHALELVSEHRRQRARRDSDRRGGKSERVSRRLDRQRLDHRAAVSAHAVRSRHHARRRVAICRRRPGIWIEPCITAKSNPRYAA